MIAENKLYHDNRNNCVFVGYDIADIPRYALRIGTNPDNKFKGEVKGSNKAFAPEILSSLPTYTVCVFESIIDAMSVLTLYNLNYDLISLSGVSGRKLEQYLDDNKSIKQIVFMLNNDEVGMSTMKELMSKYTKLGYDIGFKLSKEKDWNDELVAKSKSASILEKIKESKDNIGKTNKRFSKIKNIEM